MKVFLPIILGFLVLFIGLLAVSALAFWWRHYRLWHLGKAENRSDQGATRLKTLLAVTFGHVRFWKELYPGSMLPELLLGDVELEGAESKHHAGPFRVGHSPPREIQRIAQVQGEEEVVDLAVLKPWAQPFAPRPLPEPLMTAGVWAHPPSSETVPL